MMTKETRYKLEVNINIIKEENPNPGQDHAYWSPTQCILG